MNRIELIECMVQCGEFQFLFMRVLFGAIDCVSCLCVCALYVCLHTLYVAADVEVMLKCLHCYILLDDTHFFVVV